MESSCAKQLDSPSTFHAYWEEPDQRNTEYVQHYNYHDKPKYVVEVLGGAVSKTYRHLPESRNHRQ